MKIKGDDVIFSTGKIIFANMGKIGLSEPKLGEYSKKIEWQISEGYDGGIDCDELTKKEKIEMADYMIDLWRRFKQHHIE